jgi:hypothetical protein
MYSILIFMFALKFLYSLPSLPGKLTPEEAGWAKVYQVYPAIITNHDILILYKEWQIFISLFSWKVSQDLEVFFGVIR